MFYHFFLCFGSMIKELAPLTKKQQDAFVIHYENPLICLLSYKTKSNKNRKEAFLSACSQISGFCDKPKNQQMVAQ